MSHASILRKIKVLDLSRILAGPFCSQILSDQGAEIIKIESPEGDETRRWGPPFKNGQSAYFTGINRNKKSLVLDLRSQDSLKALHQLLSTSDVLIENFKYRDMNKFGLSSAILKKKYPRLIHCQISGFGSRGDFKTYPGYDAAIQAWSGLMSINGSEGPTKVGVPIVDLVTGQNCAFAILAALFEREFSGLGQKIETSLFENAISILHPQASNFFFSNKLPTRLGNTHPNIAPYDLFQTRDLGIYIACGNDRQFQKLCEVLNLKNLGSDKLFLTNRLRIQNRKMLEKKLRPALLKESAVALAKRLLKFGVPAGPALDIPKALKQSPVKDLKILRKSGKNTYIMPPFQFSRSKMTEIKASPVLGGHTLKILNELNLSKEEIKNIMNQQKRVK